LLNTPQFTITKGFLQYIHISHIQCKCDYMQYLMVLRPYYLYS